MAFSWLQGPPTHRHISPLRPIPPSVALSNIESYLNAADTNDHLHPDCTFTEHGPTRHNSEKGLVLQLLDRVRRGLAGERMAAELDDLDQDAHLQPDETAIEDSVTTLPLKQADRLDADAETLPLTDDARLDAAIKRRNNGLDTDEEDALQTNEIVDKSYNEQMLEQGEKGIIEGEIGERSNVAGDAAHPTSNSNLKRKGTPLTKEEKKRHKQEQRKEELRRKNAEREIAAKTYKAGTASTNVDDVDMQRQVEVNHDDEIDSVIVQNAPVHDTANPPINKPLSEKEKEDRKARRKAEKKAKKLAKQQVNGQMPQDTPNEVEKTVHRPEERGKVQVVNKRGQEAGNVMTGADVAGELEKEKKKKKKKADRANEATNGEGADGTVKTKKEKSDKKQKQVVG